MRKKSKAEEEEGQKEMKDEEEMEEGRERKQGRGEDDRKRGQDHQRGCPHGALISHFPAVLPSSETDGLKHSKASPGRKHCFNLLRSRQIHWHSACEVV